MEAAEVGIGAADDDCAANSVVDVERPANAWAAW